VDRTRIRPGGTWGSALSSAEFAAIRGAGFEPVGQVFGAAVYDAGSFTGYGCSPDGRGSYGPLVQAMYQARQTAIDRMAVECAALGGHGVVGVRLSRGGFFLGGLEFTAIGTAVRAQGAGAGAACELPAPFTSDLSGQDFAKLITTGWVPAGLVLGIWIGSRHDDLTTRRQARWRSGNAEITGWASLVTYCRQESRRQLESEVRRLGAEGVVIAAMQLEVRQRDCPVTVGRHDHIVEATVIGTAIAQFTRPGPSGARIVMSLDRQRRGGAAGGRVAGS
jgi:uncharacterized protein YbjQ (UPF0145 family)